MSPVPLNIKIWAITCLLLVLLHHTKGKILLDCSSATSEAGVPGTGVMTSVAVVEGWEYQTQSSSPKSEEVPSYELLVILRTSIGCLVGFRTDAKGAWLDRQDQCFFASVSETHQTTNWGPQNYQAAHMMELPQTWEKRIGLISQPSTTATLVNDSCTWHPKPLMWLSCSQVRSSFSVM